MANFADNISKTVATGYSIYNLAGSLGLLGSNSPARGGSLSDAVASEIRKNGVARPTYAYSQIILPPKLSQKFGRGNSPTFLTYRNDSFSIPGISVATNEVRRHGYGPTEKKPYGVNFQDVTFNYILDASSNQHKLFYGWLDSIVAHRAGAMTVTQELNGNYPYEVQYKSNYAAQMIIHYFDETFDKGGKESKAHIVDAYPTFIGDIQYNWAGTDQLIRLPVTFTYRSWYLEEDFLSNDLNATATTARGVDLFSALLKAGSAIQALSTVRSPRNVSDVLNAVNIGKKIF